MLNKFKTIYKPAEIEIFEKKSRFIGYAFPLECEEAAMAELAALRKMHAKAAHNCFAYCIGQKGQLTRQSDDGEPSGTAGMPILDFIQKQDIKNILIVVTRYFGGTLLGTGGLVRAYGRAAKEAATAAIIIEKVLYQQFDITVPYTLGGKIEHEIRTKGWILTDTQYTDNIVFTVYTEIPNADALENHITNITASTAEINRMAAVYCADIEGKFTIF
ncbi:MAG: YigZ family protein [Defluviitaleaceae bacterium]|nr:YigZ family protein [Defluviitaleaceae bacterium]